MTTQFLLSDLRHDEAPNGLPILKAYGDPLTKGPPWTIGFGSTGPDITEDTVWTEDQAEIALEADVSTLTRQCESAFVWWDTLTPPRQDVLVMMGYQMGFQGLLGFSGMLACIAKGDFVGARNHMLASLWAKQTPSRAEREADQMASGVRAPQSYDTQSAPEPAPAPAPQPKETPMSIVSSALHFVWDHTFAALARSAATTDPTTAQTAITAIQASPAPAAGGSPNSPAGVASGPIAALENDINALVMNFVKSTVDQLPVVGGVAEVTGLDTQAADAAKALLVLGEQHALTFMSSAFSQAHGAVNAVTVPASNGAAAAPQAQG
jgi:GH24 family phage-related lysozyme (muramidase)